MQVYLDNSATTKPCEAAVKSALAVMNEEYGNPSSLHMKGFNASVLLENSRRTIAESLSCEPSCVYFTPCGTVSNNTAIFGAVNLMRRRGNKIVTTAFEHPSVARCMDKLSQEGFEVVRLSPDLNGEISPDKFEKEIDGNTILVSLMAVNNEIGSILPFDKIKAIIKRKKSPALLHVDAVQGYMKINIKPEKCGIDLLSVSAHKVHALKGCGALYIDRAVRIKPYILGGGQEGNICSGTQAMPNIAAFSAAVSELGGIGQRLEKIKELNGYTRRELLKIPGVSINSPESALAYILNISLKGIPSQVSVNYFSQNGVFVSAGSACSKGHRSDTLTSMGLPVERIDSAVRISFSCQNTKEETDFFLKLVNTAFSELSKK